MNRNMIETVLGAVVLLAAAVFLGFAYNSADLNQKKEGYRLTADFDRLDGLKAGSDVRMNGVLVGSVQSIRLDNDTYRATATFTVDSALKLPTDTNAAIMVATDGSGKLTRTTPPMRLDDLIGQLIYNKPSEKKQAAGTGNEIVTPAPPNALIDPTLPKVAPPPQLAPAPAPTTP
jgi:phospholipid/cholesterol/gamma-HCH transport system substrate-binding protein